MASLISIQAQSEKQYDVTYRIESDSDQGDLNQLATLLILLKGHHIMQLFHLHLKIYHDRLTHRINFYWPDTEGHFTMLAQFCCRQQLWHSVAAFPISKQPMLMPDPHGYALRTVLFLLGIDDTRQAFCCSIGKSRY